MHIVHTYIKNMGIDVNNKDKFTFADRWGLVSQAKLGHNVTLVCGGHVRKKKTYKWKGINIIELPVTLELTDTSRIVKGLFRELLKIKVDVFHTHHYSSFIPEITIIAAKIRSKPVFLTLHTAFNEQDGFKGVLEKIYYIMFQPTLYFYNNVFYVSNYLKDKYLGDNSKKVAVHNDFLTPPKIKVKRKNNTLFFIGRLAHQKGIDIIIRAIQTVRKEIPHVQFEIYGKGEEKYKNKLMSLVKKLNLENNVSFCGPVYGNEKWKKYYSSTIQIIPSREEGFGNVVIEGMLCNTPIIVSNDGALPEVSAGYALIFDINKPKDLARKIIKLLKDKKLRNNMSKDANKYANKFITGDIGKQLVKYYNDA
jgi:glycosyltransferase involved in cell wall biosynthesis